MPSLDFQPFLQKHFGLLGAQSLIHIREDKKRVCCPWKSFWFSRTRRVDFNEETRFNRLSVKAVATLQLRSLVHKVNGNEGTKSSNLAVDSSPVPTESDGDSGGSDEAERLRRSRISRANKGNTPWNKGKKHSPETIERIREKTKLAMQNPKVKMKLATLGRHAQSKATRTKIGVGVRLGWQKRREMLLVQETCHFDWKNLIAEASRRGCAGEGELQWDSYKILGAQLEQEWLESVKQRKTMPKPKSRKRAPKSLEQRSKIAEAIAAKWADPVYRDRVISGLSKFHGFQIGTGVKKKTQRRPSSAQSTKQRSRKKRSDGSSSSFDVDAENQILQPKKKRRDGPLHKDPLASSKLEMIKNIRAQRAAAETKKTEAIERARLLIAEAEKAAHALEIAATKSPVAQASLSETRKLIAEAIQSIEYIETGMVTFNKNYDHPSEPSPIVVDPIEEITYRSYDELVNQVKREVNGKENSLQSKDDEGFFFSDFGMQELLNTEKVDHSMNLNGDTLPPFYPGKQYNSLKTDSITGDQVGVVETHEEGKSDRLPRVNGTSVDSVEDETPVKPVAVTRKWVRGRLVEVSE